MPLTSNLLADNARLQSCLIADNSHVTPGDQGEHVQLIQVALVILDDSSIDKGEVSLQTYGPSTASAVQDYKRKRKIINHAYQNAADDIVGKMTIRSLDDELVANQRNPRPYTPTICKCGGAPLRSASDPRLTPGTRLRFTDRSGRRI